MLAMSLHQVAHLGAAAHWNRDGFGNGRDHFRHLLQQHGGGARGVVLRLLRGFSSSSEHSRLTEPTRRHTALIQY